MDIPRFERESLNRRLVPGELGDAFQRFSGDVLRVEYPGLHTFPTAGKDGGIDHVDSGEARTVFECKLVGEDSYRRVEQAWQEVARLLERHLANPAGPTPGQAQYEPWYRTDPPIARYVLVTSAEIANLANRDDLRDTIRGSFRALAARHAHLAHLAAVEVEIKDWADLVAVLRRRPHLVFRWFPVARPGGLVPLDESPPVGTFRSYLDSSKLPYYSLAGHLASHGPPQGVSILSEADLLAALEPADTSGMVIHGAGGVGKTRLSLELGRMALDQGWTVLRVDGRLRPGALERLAEGLDPKTPALLVIDYVETQGDFAELVEDVNLLNDAFSLRIRYVASCRTGYYPVVEPLGRHQGVGLSPPPGDAARQWLEDYRQATVRHILDHTGIQVTRQYLEACHQNPVLAVFMAYLHAAGRHEDLAELLGEEDFGRWVAKRVQLSFQTSIRRELALLMTLFPMSDDAARGLSGEPYRPLFDRLSADGWIEPSRPEESAPADLWRSAHDVLADQIVLSYVRTIPATAGHFIDEVLERAASAGCLDSALVACQRLGQQPPLVALDWAGILDRHMAAEPGAWQGVAGLVIRTPLLTPAQTIALLGRRSEIWEGSLGDVGFQNALGWLARWAVSAGAEALPGADRETLVSWVRSAGSRLGSSNFILTWGLRLAPEVLADVARQWINDHPAVFQTHYLMVAWLVSGLPAVEVRGAVETWCSRFADATHLSFLARAWLEAKGEPEVFRQPIQSWLAWHRRATQAEFVYKAWLDAGGEKDLVREPIRAWLAEHGTDAEARFVYKGWVDAGGDKDLVHEPIRAWVEKHGTGPEAGFVYQPWLDAGGEKDLVREAIRAWLENHGTDPEAGFVYKGWLDAGGEKELVREPIRAWLEKHRTAPEAAFVYQPWLDAGGDKDLVRDPIRAWLQNHGTDAEAPFVYKAWLDAGGDTELVAEPIRAWLEKHGTAPEARFVYRAWLDAGGDKDLVREPIRVWVEKHGTEPEAGFVYQPWLDAGGDFATVRDRCLAWLHCHRERADATFVSKAVIKQPDRLPLEAVKDILHWCRAFAQDENALWRLSQLKRRLFEPGAAEETSAAVEAVLNARLQGGTVLHATAREHITQVVSSVILLTHRANPNLRARVDAVVVRWLRHPQSYGRKPAPYRSYQQPAHVDRVAYLLETREIDVRRDRAALERFLHWVNAWEAERKAAIRPILEGLRREFPAKGLWEIVELD